VERILVLGSPGAGKSTLATALAERTGLPLHHLDQLYWQPGWIEPDPVEWRATLDHVLDQSRWIIDGNYGGTLGARLARADTVIDLDLPAWRCLARVIGRVRAHRGRVRPDMAAGCPERHSWEFLLYIARFPFASRRRLDQRLDSFTGRRIRLTSDADAAAFLAML
jgi:adenylate kinase family enzyme